MICYTVSDVNKFIKQIFSYIKCVMFHKQADKLAFLPENGMFVVKGNIGVYERDGIYQIYVVNMVEDGCGSIKKDLDDLTLKLMNEGIFDSNKKLPIPENPKEIGVITSPDGAALQDIIQVLSRRMPMLKVKVYPALVQGKEAVDSIVNALKLVAIDRPDILIIEKGGGSAEDLSAFNSEIVVREVQKIDIPVISAVGHETDRCLLDLVADLRAPTPSAAAELVCLDIREIKYRLDSVMKRIEMCVQNIIDRYSVDVCDLKNKLDYLSPYYRVLRLYERTDQLSKMLDFSISKIIEKIIINWERKKFC